MDAVIFDCDGVLVDSEVIASRVVADMFVTHVPGLDRDEFVRDLAGVSDAEVIERCRNDFGAEFPDDFLQQVEDAVDDALNRDLRAIPGAAVVVRNISLAKAVASNSRRARVDRSLRRANLSDAFGERIFSAEQVALPKPAPDVYLLAAEGLHASPDHCLVVEDSTAGVTAATAAGMTVIGFTGASHVQPGHAEALLQAGAVEVVADMPSVGRTISRFLTRDRVGAA